MKLLVVGDIHYALKQYDWLLTAAPRFDAVVIVGDLLEISSMVDRPAQVVVVRRYLQAIANLAPLFVCSGNHDLTEEGPSGERQAGWLGLLPGTNLVRDGERQVLGDLLVSVFPWWDGPETKAAVARQMAEDKAEADGRWLWVYHAPPAASPTSWAGTRHFGDPDLEAWIGEFRPDYVLCGHVHQAPFTRDGAWADRIGDAWVFNMGQQPGEVPSYIVIDTEVQAAIWHSLAGLEHIELAAETARAEPLSDLPPWLKA